MSQIGYVYAYMDGPIYFTLFAKRPSYMYTYADFRWPDPPSPNGFYPGLFLFAKGKVN